MEPSDISRRAFVVSAGLIAVGAGIGGWRLGRNEPLFLSAHHSHSERPHVSAFDGQGRLRFRLPIALRAHAAVGHPVKRHIAVVIARRPGNLMYEIDLADGAIRRVVRSADNRHFYGHGVYSPDGRYLFTTENDFGKGVGVVGVRDAEKLAPVAELPAHGVGPHELVFLSDGQTLVVANGGIRTHPDQPREKLNIPTMEPSLAYVDAANGTLLARFTLDNRFLSIRHLAIGREDLIGIALQYEGPREDAVPLVGFQHGDEPITLAMGEDSLLRRLKNYTGSICLHPATGIAAVSCPRGGQVTFWGATAARCVGAMPIREAGGISLSANGQCFVVTNGLGEIHTIRADTLTPTSAPITIPDTMWDNHLTLTSTTVVVRHQRLNNVDNDNIQRVLHL